MSFAWVSFPDCGHCGATGHSTDVTYDYLGYPICRRCRLLR
jgi:hypothetical protein